MESILWPHQKNSKPVPKCGQVSIFIDQKIKIFSENI